MEKERRAERMKKVKAGEWGKMEGIGEQKEKGDKEFWTFSKAGQNRWKD